MCRLWFWYKSLEPEENRTIDTTLFMTAGFPVGPPKPLQPTGYDTQVQRIHRPWATRETGLWKYLPRLLKIPGTHFLFLLFGLAEQGWRVAYWVAGGRGQRKMLLWPWSLVYKIVIGCRKHRGMSWGKEAWGRTGPSKSSLGVDIHICCGPKKVTNCSVAQFPLILYWYKNLSQCCKNRSILYTICKIYICKICIHMRRYRYDERSK